MPPEQPMQPQMPPQAPPEFAPPMPAPTSPPGMPRDPSVGLSQDEMRANLQQMMSDLTAKMAESSASHDAVGGMMQDNTNQMLKMLFDFFTQAGVDPSSPDEVLAFIEQLKQKSPEIAQQLGKVLQRISSKSQGAPENMNTNPNEEIPQNV